MRLLICFSVIVTLLVAGCAELPPNNNKNVCSIFRQYPHWYWSARKVRHRWNVPISVIMAFMYQESRYQAKAKPPRERLLGFIPWFRPSSSYGYAQALDATWRRYEKDTHRILASRSSFSDAADFIGWYADQAHQRAGISKRNAYAIYLAYHEGIGGYSRGVYKHNASVKRIARKVEHRAMIFQGQLKACQSSLPKKPWWKFW